MTKCIARGLIIIDWLIVGRVELMSISYLQNSYLQSPFAFMSAYSNTHFHQYHVVRHRAFQVQTADNFHILDVCHRVPGVALPFVPMDDLNYYKYMYIFSFYFVLRHRDRRQVLNVAI